MTINKYDIPPMPKNSDGEIDLPEYRNQLWNTVHLYKPDVAKGARAFDLSRIAVWGLIIVGVLVGVLHAETIPGNVLTGLSTMAGVIFKLRGVI